MQCASKRYSTVGAQHTAALLPVAGAKCNSTVVTKSTASGAGPSATSQQCSTHTHPRAVQHHSSRHGHQQAAARARNERLCLGAARRHGAQEVVDVAVKRWPRRKCGSGWRRWRRRQRSVWRRRQMRGSRRVSSRSRGAAVACRIACHGRSIYVITLAGGGCCCCCGGGGGGSRGIAGKVVVCRRRFNSGRWQRWQLWRCRRRRQGMARR